METEEQQLEEIKRWWQENGRTVVAGVVLGLGGVSGWTLWQSHVNEQAEEVSTRYERLVNTAALPNREAAVRQTDTIIAEHPDSSYAGLAALVGAQAAYGSGDAETARRLLEWAAANAAEFHVRDVARIRLSRLLSDAGEHDAALARLDEVGTGPFATLAKEVRGDVLWGRNDASGARAAYESALGDDALRADVRGRIEAKLDAIAAAGG